MPDAEQGFYDQALLRAVHTGTRRQRNRWLMTGFGSAVAAGVLVLLVSGMFFNAPQTPGLDDVNGDIPGVSIALAEPRTVNLMFASAEPLDDAMLTVLLPDGVELDGFPGQREVSWQTSLAAGKNLLPLKLIAVSPEGGELLAKLEHKDRNRTFRLRVNVS
jgi:hypothetical protein